jgi:AhpD family alkylhydroperoxidase
MSSAIPPLDERSAPAEARPPLEGLRHALGFTPNLALAMAHAPASLASYVTGLQAVGKLLTPCEAQLVMLAASSANGAAYGVALHAALARRAGASSDALDAARSGRDNAMEPRLRSLLRVSRLSTERRPTAPADIEGFAPAELIELIYAVSLKQFANAVAALSGVPIDATLLEEADA